MEGETKISCDIAGVRFNYRAAAICIEDGYVLLNRINGMDFWFLPGGRIDVGETAAEAVEREMREELGIPVEVGRLVWVVETFFRVDGRPCHELGLYHRVSLPEDSPYADKGVTYQRATEWGGTALFRWFPLDALGELALVPPFLKDGLQAIPRDIEHRIERR